MGCSWQHAGENVAWGAVEGVFHSLLPPQDGYFPLVGNTGIKKWGRSGHFSVCCSFPFLNVSHIPKQTTKTTFFFFSDSLKTVSDCAECTKAGIRRHLLGEVKNSGETGSTKPEPIFWATLPLPPLSQPRDFQNQHKHTCFLHLSISEQDPTRQKKYIKKIKAFSQGNQTHPVSPSSAALYSASELCHRDLSFPFPHMPPPSHLHRPHGLRPTPPRTAPQLTAHPRCVHPPPPSRKVSRSKNLPPLGVC